MSWGEKRRGRRLDREWEQFDASGHVPRPSTGPWSITRGTVRPPRQRRMTPGRGTLVATVLVTGLLLSLFVALHPSDEAERIRNLLGFDAERILAAPALPPDRGSYAFTDVQRDGRTPVGYDPCRTIEVEINPAGAPEDNRELVETSISRISAATGLSLEIIGETTRRVFIGDLSQNRRPVLIAWSTEESYPELAGDIAGVAGSLPREGSLGHRTFVRGFVLLDSNDFTAGDLPREYAQAIVDHEFGHLVGLAHVDDPDELMHPRTTGKSGFGEGDLRGLAEIGRISCG